MMGHKIPLLAVQEEVECEPPPTAQTSPLLTMNTEFKLFRVPIATPFVQAKPFQ
jgi:hypothetical protein